jgi:hypothetical protein
MPMRPVLPPYADETTVSWCSRVAQFHTGLSCPDFLKLVQISQADVMDLSNSGVERLSKLTGVSKAQILKCGPQKAGNRLLTYKGEIFGPAFMTRTCTTYCPACLLDDAEVGASGQRVGRLSWMFAPVRVCPRHNIVLTRRKNLGYFERFQNMNKVAPSDGELADQAANSPTAVVSSLQEYAGGRLTNGTGDTWLDTQRIDQAARACEMLGICRINGANSDIDQATTQQWNEAGTIGFEAASRGREGIYEILEEIVRDATVEKRWGGPQSVLGRMYKWLQYNASDQAPGPIEDIVYDFITDEMPIEPGTKLFGRVVQRRNKHTVATLAKQTGVHKKTLNRALVVFGLLDHGDRNNVVIRETFDAAVGEALARRIKHSIPIKSIPAYINCNRTQAQMMVKAGILNKISSDASVRTGVLTNVSIDDVDAFLEKFQCSGRAVSETFDGMLNVIEASEVARETVTDIVQLVLDGKLSRVVTLEGDLRFRSVFVDPSEVKVAISDLENAIGYSADEVGERLEIFPSGLSWLRKPIDRNGQPFLRAIETPNARGTIRYRYAEEEILKFERGHVSLTQLAKERGLSSKAVAKSLRDSGIEPIIQRKFLNAAMYRRSDL